MQNLIIHFSKVEEPRKHWNQKHKLIDIIVITVCAAICGYKSWYDIVAFAKVELEWLKQWLELPNGIPSHDTFRRVFSMLKPDSLENAFRNWVRSMVELPEGTHLAFDGKASCGTGKQGEPEYVHMVGVYASELGLSIAQLKVEHKKSEIQAIKDLVKTVDVKDCVITIDAIACKRPVFDAITEAGAHYIINVKKNCRRLYEDIEASTCSVMPYDSAHEHIDFGHGRIETRKIMVYSDLDYVRGSAGRAGFNAIIKLESIRHDKKSGKEKTEVRYYMTDLRGSSAETLGGYIRAHWSIENNLHWMLDVLWDEDNCRKRKNHEGENISRIRRLALNMLTACKEEFPGFEKIKMRMIRAQLDRAYRERVLTSVLAAKA